jgi:hypothetical protein
MGSRRGRGRIKVAVASTARSPAFVVPVGLPTPSFRAQTSPVGVLTARRRIGPAHVRGFFGSQHQRGCLSPYRPVAAAEGNECTGYAQPRSNAWRLARRR